MTLRRRLVLFSTVQLVVLGVFFAALYAQIQYVVLPAMWDHLRSQTQTTAQTLAEQLEVPLGAEDPALIDGVLAPILSDPNLAFLEVRDEQGKVVHPPGRSRTSGLVPQPQDEVHTQGGAVVYWTPVTLEGLHLGKVLIGFRANRVDSIRVWLRWLGAGALLVWLGAFAYSLVFARAFVAPVEHMMEFSRSVAAGAFDQELACAATGELRPLVDNLNAMARELSEREIARIESRARSEALQSELLTVSRMAGMAEVATGVLHNVGNVLNSLNVSVSLVEGRLRTSKVATLARSVELFQVHPGGLPAFLATEKGRLLVPYLVSVSSHLTEENAVLRAEIDLVSRNVEHIKTIVTTQQDYARAVGTTEPLHVAGLMDDALRLAEASFSRFGIEVIRAYEEVPPLVADRHKLMQVFINLVSNARHALQDDASEASRRLMVGIAGRPEGGVLVTVADNGVGIPAENLVRIFEHGFTTKTNGHGFGLHASANAVRELGGTLIAASDGPALGATFTVVLPLEPEENALVSH